MKFTDFTKINLDKYNDSEVIRQTGIYPNVAYTVGGTDEDGHIIMTVHEAKWRQGYNLRPEKTYSEWLNESLENIYGGDTREIPTK